MREGVFLSSLSPGPIDRRLDGGPRRGGGVDTIRGQKRPLGEARWPDHIVTRLWRGVPLAIPDPSLVVVDLSLPALVAGRRA